MSRVSSTRFHSRCCVCGLEPSHVLTPAGLVHPEHWQESERPVVEQLHTRWTRGCFASCGILLASFEPHMDWARGVCGGIWAWGLRVAF